jgi:hypothetical protein
VAVCIESGDREALIWLFQQLDLLNSGAIERWNSDRGI